MAPPRHKKVPFSNKQKKEQLRERRERKKYEKRDELEVDGQRATKNKEVDENHTRKKYLVQKINHQPETSRSSDKNYDPNRFTLHFRRDTDEEVARGKALAMEPIHVLPEEACEIDLEEIYQPGSALDMPKRPYWDYSISKEELNFSEQEYFKDYLNKILEKFDVAELSYYEMNLETWRQLWRVLEMSDVVLLISDIRHPALHFSPALYEYVTKDLQKHIILVLNKIDLAPPTLVAAWKSYFQERFPEVSVVCFTSMPRDEEEINVDRAQALFKKRRRRNFTSVGPKQLLEACEKIVHGRVDMSSWKQKIKCDAEVDQNDDEEGSVEVEEKGVENYTAEREVYVFCRDQTLTIGCCGYPNVGKSSIINSLMGKKVVSVSRTPGHTKHFQTIFLTKNVRLCDSPGLVFPSLVLKPLQILSGIYPISQLREPYTTIRFLAERLPLPSILRLDQEKSEMHWSPFSICDAWAEQRGFVTARAARNDANRAANHILRMTVSGRICLCMRPPGYSKKISYWENYPETKEIVRLQEMGRGVRTFSEAELKDEDTSEDESLSEDDERSKDHIKMSNPFGALCDY